MLAMVLDALPISMFWKDRDSRIVGCNQKFADDSGVARPADLVGISNFEFYPPEQAEKYRADDLEVMTSGVSKLGIEEPLLLPSGETSWVETNKVPIRNSAGDIVGVICTSRDITERRRSGDERMRFALELAVAQQAAATAKHDFLTNLPNRRYLREKLCAYLLGGQTIDRLAIVALDLDRFKKVNDLYGHAVGDELLQKVAHILTQRAGSGGFVARIGGDEFVLLMPFKSKETLIRRFSALIAIFDRPIELAEHEASVGVTLGVAETPKDGVDADLLLRRADMALYRAKQLGRARFAFFEPDMDELVRERALLERDLRTAVKEDEIIPYFQPQVQLQTGITGGYEVLARWPHSERGIIAPSQFIKIAEDVGLISELTMNLLRRACRETLNWPGRPRIAINISAVQLRDVALAQKLLKVLSECGFPAARLEIEITEDALVSDVEAAKVILISLKNLGVRVALDDFGTGYSSLQHLRDLPFDDLKIDQSFVRTMGSSDDSLVIVKTIIQLAKSLKLDVTAEGIETEAQEKALRALGCERGQGFYFGCPFQALSPIDLPRKPHKMAAPKMTASR